MELWVCTFLFLLLIENRALLYFPYSDPEFHRGKIYYRLIVGVLLACTFYEYCESCN